MPLGTNRTAFVANNVGCVRILQHSGGSIPHSLGNDHHKINRFPGVWCIFTDQTAPSLPAIVRTTGRYVLPPLATAQNESFPLFMYIVQCRMVHHMESIYKRTAKRNGCFQGNLDNRIEGAGKPFTNFIGVQKMKY